MTEYTFWRWLVLCQHEKYQTVSSGVFGLANRWLANRTDDIGGHRFILSWSLYLILMRIENPNARNFMKLKRNSRIGVFSDGFKRILYTSKLPMRVKSIHCFFSHKEIYDIIRNRFFGIFRL